MAPEKVRAAVATTIVPITSATVVMVGVALRLPPSYLFSHHLPAYLLLRLLLPAIHYLLPTTHYLHLTTYYLLPNTYHCLTPTTHSQPANTIHYLPPTTYYLLLLRLLLCWGVYIYIYTIQNRKHTT